MAHTLQERLAELPNISRPKLLAMWSEFFSSPPPLKLRKDLLVPILAYRMQEKEHGGLSHGARQRLVDIAKRISGKKVRSTRSTDPPDCTRLVRIWRGEVHEVLCLADGYTYRDKKFTSLSKIAKEITGTPWSGPAFFGTKGKSK